MKSIIYFFNLIVISIGLSSVAHGQIVVIDPGHGYDSSCNPGCADPRTDTEIETAHAVSLKLKALIDQNCNWSSYMTVPMTAPILHCGDCVTINQRAAMSDSWNADRLLSVHCNAGGGTGTETYWCDESDSFTPLLDQAFADEVNQQMVLYGQWYDRGIKEFYDYSNGWGPPYPFHLGVLSYTNAISCLNEIGFVDTPNDAAKLLDDGWRDQFALAYYVALQNNLNSNCSGGGCPAPSNDDCANATSITPNGACESGDVVCATVSGVAQASCDLYSSGTPHLQDVWYTFTATTSGTYTITVSPNSSSTDISNLDAVLALYSGTCGSLSPVANGCADSGGGSGTSETVSVSLSVGTHWIRIYDYGSQSITTGGFSLCVTGGSTASATITNFSISPSSVCPCGSFTINYTINSTGAISNAILGASIAPTGTTSYIDDEPNDLEVSLPSGTSTWSRTFTVPCGTTPGSYDVFAGIWVDDNNNGQIDPATDTNLDADQLNGALTVSNCCSYSLSSSSQNFSSSGGSGSFNVNTTSGCAWTASESCSWVNITSGSSGTGSGTVSYSVDANPNQSFQTCVITAAGESYTITQDGATGGGDPNLIGSGPIMNTFQNEVQLQMDIENIGGSSAGSSVVRFFASTDNTITINDYTIANLNVNSIPANDHDGVILGYTDLCTNTIEPIPSGTYFIGWLVDVNDDVYEGNSGGEQDNTGVFPGSFLTINCTTVGQIEHQSSEFQLIPNPNSGQFELVLPTLLENGNFQVFDNIGQVVKQGRITSDRTQIDMNGFAEGVYTLQLLDGVQSLGVERVVLMK